MAPSEPEFITIGEILAPWGLRGQLKVRVLTDFPERFSPTSKVYINRRLMTITDTIWQKANAIISLSDVSSTAEAKKLQGQPVAIHHSQLKDLPEGQYYHFQLIGLKVRTTDGKHLGSIKNILSTAGNDVYVVRGAEGEEVLIPAVDDVVKSIDVDKGHIIIEAIEGVLDLNKRKSG